MRTGKNRNACVRHERTDEREKREPKRAPLSILPAPFLSFLSKTRPLRRSATSARLTCETLGALSPAAEAEALAGSKPREGLPFASKRALSMSDLTS